jgi:flagellar biogenesis protein FliO
LLAQSPFPRLESQIRNLQSALRSLSVTLCVLMLTGSAEAQTQLPHARQPGVVTHSPDGRQMTQNPRLDQQQAQATRSPSPHGRRITKPSRTISPPDDRKTENTRSPNSLGTTLVALSFVVLLILVAAKLWSKHGPAIRTGLPPEALQVLGKRQLNQRQTVYLARLGSRILVLGSSANGLQTLCEITDPIEVDFLAGVCRGNDNHTTMAQTFRTLFKKQLSPSTSSSRSKSPPDAEDVTGNAELGMRKMESLLRTAQSTLRTGKDRLSIGQSTRDTTTAPEPRLENIRG